MLNKLFQSEENVNNRFICFSEFEKSLKKLTLLKEICRVMAFELSKGPVQCACITLVEY